MESSRHSIWTRRFESRYEQLSRRERFSGDMLLSVNHVPCNCATDAFRLLAEQPRKQKLIVTSHIEDSKDEKLHVFREVYGRAGKLLLHVRESPFGPVVGSVEPRSCLRGRVFSGDLILEINNQRTDRMEQGKCIGYCLRKAVKSV